MTPLLTLLRWLGPWSGASSAPRGIRRETWRLRDGAPSGQRADRAGVRRDLAAERALEAYVYEPPEKPIATYLIAPGLHFLGPDDPRLDRFCRVLARAGFRVVAPFVPSFLDLIVAPSAPDDLELCARATLERFPREPLGMFSISFGSWPALEVAARLGGAVDGVVTFGGYADFEAAVRFAVDGIMRTPSGDFTLARDPLNSPALFLNVLAHIEPVPPDTRELEAAWRAMAYRTWGKMGLKRPGKLAPIAHALAPSVPEPLRELFLIGCGVLPGSAELLEAALARAGDGYAFADPRRAIERIDCPVVVCHGRDDDVIPWGEAEKLAGLLERRVPTRLVLTGMFGHTGAERPTPRRLVQEAGSLLAIGRALSMAGKLGAFVR